MGSISKEVESPRREISLSQSCFYHEKKVIPTKIL